MRERKEESAAWHVSEKIGQASGVGELCSDTSTAVQRAISNPDGFPFEEVIRFSSAIDTHDLTSKPHDTSTIFLNTIFSQTYFRELLSCSYLSSSIFIFLLSCFLIFDDFRIRVNLFYFLSLPSSLLYIRLSI